MPSFESNLAAVEKAEEQLPVRFPIGRDSFNIHPKLQIYNDEGMYVPATTIPCDSKDYHEQLTTRELSTKDKFGIRWYLSDTTLISGPDTIRSIRLYKGESQDLVTLKLDTETDQVSATGPGEKAFIKAGREPKEEFLRGLAIIATASAIKALADKEELQSRAKNFGRRMSTSRLVYNR